MNPGRLKLVSERASVPVPYKEYPDVVSIDIDAGRLLLALDFHRDTYLANRLALQLNAGYSVILREIQARAGDCFEAEKLPPHLKRAWEFARILSETAGRSMRASSSEGG